MSSVSEKEFNALLVNHQLYIKGQVLRYGGGEDTADYVQDVMVQVCRLRAGYDPEKGAFSTWLYWQIRSCVQQRRLHQNKRRALNLSMEFYDDGEPLTEAVQLGNQHVHVELCDTLDAIGDLRPRTADVILQRAVGTTLDVIADKYDITKERVRQIQERGLHSLRKKLRMPAMAGAC